MSGEKRDDVTQPLAVPSPGRSQGGKGFRKILAPVDFSAHSRRALETAAWLAAQNDATVDVLYVGMPPSAYGPLDQWIWGSERDEHDVAKTVEDAEHAAFDGFWKDLPKSVRARAARRVEHGSAADIITSIAEQEGHDLIVLGTHGRTAKKHMLLGCVAERVTRHAPCAVMLVP